jgi:hypothetical protein
LEGMKTIVYRTEAREIEPREWNSTASGIGTGGWALHYLTLYLYEPLTCSGILVLHWTC